MLARPLLMSSLAVFAAPGAWAQVEGRYAGKGEGDLSAVIRRGSAPDTYRITLKTRSGTCSGEVSGTAKLADGNFTLRASTDTRKGCTAVIAVKGRQLEVEEREGCLYFHGVSCGFSGTLQRR